MVIVQLDIHMQKHEVNFLPHTIYQNKYLNVRTKTFKFLEDIDINIRYLGSCYDLLDMTLKGIKNRQIKIHQE